jgi:glycosyltransferase involved in cell wall biosynthesis
MVDNKPRVSIGMPVYNGEQFLKEALDSILAQSFKNFNLIISDNGSTDKTEEICRAYAAKDQRIYYERHEQNLGAGWNFNRVFELSSAEYFRWACYDDLCAPELLERCVEGLDRYPSVILCYPKTIIINEHGEHIQKYFDGFNLRSLRPHERFERYHNLVRYGHGCHPLYGLIRAKTLKMALPMGSYPSSDLVLLGELALHGEFYEIPEYLFFKRDHPNTSVRAHQAFRERIAWYDPAKKGQLHLTRWKWLFDYLAAIRRVQMSWNEKVRCYIQMAKWLLWNWIWLAKDLIKAVSWPFVRPFLNFK